MDEQWSQENKTQIYKTEQDIEASLSKQPPVKMAPIGLIITIIACTFALLLGMGVVIFSIYDEGQQVQERMQEQSDTLEQYLKAATSERDVQDKNGVENSDQPEDSTIHKSQAFEGKTTRYTQEPFDVQTYTSDKDYFLSNTYQNSWNGNHVNHTRKEFKGDFYPAICECIDYSEPYEISRHYYEYKPDDGNVTIRMAYMQLEGDIPNLKQLNQDIIAYTSYLARAYYDAEEQNALTDAPVVILTDSYVTYNDKNRISIVVDENWGIADKSYMNLYPINIDLQAGKILDNCKILNITPEFITEYKLRSNYQNGEVEILNQMSDDEILDYLTDPETCILFYTPIGMEVGYNYMLGNDIGWLMSSYSDYEDFLS
ncbi:MAG: hypothetical protein RRX92_04585 [Lachnospiraceae bacterium]